MAEEIKKEVVEEVKEEKPAKKATRKTTAKKVDSETKKPAKRVAKKAEGETEVKKTTTKKATTKKTTTKKAAAEKVEAKVEETKEVKATEAVTPEVVKPAKKAKKEEKKVPTFKFRKPTIADYELLKGSYVTEKTQQLSVNNNTIVLKVDSKATANKVKSAVQAIFAIKVDKVNIINVLPKKKRVTRYEGKISGFKKAIVKINKDFNLGEINKLANEENA